MTQILISVTVSVTAKQGQIIKKSGAKKCEPIQLMMAVNQDGFYKGYDFVQSVGMVLPCQININPAFCEIRKSL